MSLFSFTPRERLHSLQEQGGAALEGARRAALQATSHLEALMDLLCLELAEYGAHQARRVLALAFGVLLLLCAYFLLCLFICVALSGWLGWLGAVGVVCLFNLLVGVLALVAGLKCRPGPLAPATRQELKNDVQCIRLFLKEKGKS